MGAFCMRWECVRARYERRARFNDEGHCPTPKGVGLSHVLELLGGIALNEEVTVVQGVEVNFDDIGIEVVNPHAQDSMGHH